MPWSPRIRSSAARTSEIGVRVALHIESTSSIARSRVVAERARSTAVRAGEVTRMPSTSAVSAAPRSRRARRNRIPSGVCGVLEVTSSTPRVRTSRWENKRSPCTRAADAPHTIRSSGAQIAAARMSVVVVTSASRAIATPGKRRTNAVSASHPVRSPASRARRTSKGRPPTIAARSRRSSCVETGGLVVEGAGAVSAGAVCGAPAESSMAPRSAGTRSEVMDRG